MRTLYLADARQLKCNEPGCTHRDCRIFLKQRCHPKAATMAYVDTELGEISIICARCDQGIARFAIAPTPPQP
jgi:hypothetical protein